MHQQAGARAARLREDARWLQVRASQETEEAAKTVKLVNARRAAMQEEAERKKLELAAIKAEAAARVETELGGEGDTNA